MKIKIILINKFGLFRLIIKEIKIYVYKYMYIF